MAMGGGPFDPGVPPPYPGPVPDAVGDPADGSGGNSSSGTTAGRLVRRFGLLAVAVLLVAAVATGLTWYVALTNMDPDTVASVADGDDGEDGADCTTADVLRTDVRNAMAGIDDEEAAEAVTALDDYADLERWRLDLFSTTEVLGDGPADEAEPRELLVSMTVDGDLVEVVRDGGDFVGLVDGGTGIVQENDSSFWVPACPNSRVLAVGIGERDCVDREESAGEVTVRLTKFLRTRPTDPSTGDPIEEPVTEPVVDCDAPTDTSASVLEVRMRDGKFTGATFTIASDSRRYVTELVPAPPADISTPWPLQTIPAWFVRLVA